MDSRPISVGDLVQIVKWPCCGSGLGFTFVVEIIVGERIENCLFCERRELTGEPVAISGGGAGKYVAARLSWLKRIDPPAQSESTTTERELTV